MYLLFVSVFKNTKLLEFIFSRICIILLNKFIFRGEKKHCFPEKSKIIINMKYKGLNITDIPKNL